MCKVRLYETTVGVLKVSYCGQCPAHTTVYKKQRVGDSYPPKFTTAIDYHKCTKTGLRVSYTELSEGCPLPVSETPAASETCGVRASCEMPAACEGQNVQ